MPSLSNNLFQYTVRLWFSCTSCTQHQNMPHETIFQNVAKHIVLDEEEKDCFAALLTEKELRKKELILREGQSCHHLNYVHSGALRAYCVDNDGKESTIMFAVKDWWVTDMYCFVNGKPAMLFIEAIEDSVVYRLTKNNFDHLFQTIPKFERFFRILMQNAYTREQVRVIENLTLPAEKRYDSFLKRYPHIAGVVTQKQIASYLGITPEFLSSIRKKKTGIS